MGGAGRGGTAHKPAKLPFWHSLTATGGRLEIISLFRAGSQNFSCSIWLRHLSRPAVLKRV